MERRTERQDGSVLCNVEIEITVCNFKTVDELLGVDVGNAGTSISVRLTHQQRSTSPATHIIAHKEVIPDLSLDVVDRDLSHVDLATGE